MRRHAELGGGAEFDRCSILVCGGHLARRAQLWCRVLWWTVVAGPLVRVETVFGETQEEQFSGIRWNGVTSRIAAIEWEHLSEEERCR